MPRQLWGNSAIGMRLYARSGILQSVTKYRLPSLACTTFRAVIVRRLRHICIYSVEFELEYGNKIDG